MTVNDNATKLDLEQQNNLLDDVMTRVPIMVDGAEEHLIGFSQPRKCGVPVHGKAEYPSRSHPNRQ